MQTWIVFLQIPKENPFWTFSWIIYQLDLGISIVSQYCSKSMERVIVISYNTG